MVSRSKNREIFTQPERYKAKRKSGTPHRHGVAAPVWPVVACEPLGRDFALATGLPSAEGVGHGITLVVGPSLGKVNKLALSFQKVKTAHRIVYPSRFQLVEGGMRPDDFAQALPKPCGTIDANRGRLAETKWWN